MPEHERTAEESLADSHAMLPGARNGGPEALGKLADRLRPYLKAVIRGELMGATAGREADHSDIVQQTLLQALRGIAGFQGHSLEEWRGWLAAIARNEARAAMRHASAGRRDAARIVTCDPDLVPASGDAPSTAMHQSDLRQQLGQAMQRLSAEQQQIIRWRQDDHLSHAEIASRLGIQIDAARQRCKAAMDALRRAWRTMVTGIDD